MSAPAKLTLDNVHVSYDESLILRGVSFTAPANSVVSLLGRNGVGKTTSLKAIMGLVPLGEGDLTFDGQSLKGMNTEKRARAGLGYVPQGRDIFPNLTIWENLKVSLSVHGQAARDRLDEVFELFPVLAEMRERKGGVLSGGQQQQLAIGRALLTNPSLLILDEPTEGIQPSIIDQIEDAIIYLKKAGNMTILLVEQYLDFAKSVSDHFCIMERGSVVESGEISLLSDELVAQYLSV
ncbi:urea ABC transporter ATP-binding subunit UrtE [Roseibacillus ishigakijimensis]|uniref:Urea ABC transporter ATP-binding subunit UrtE n=1 Tax=Roseibacillus ishigakijimensis TaxID=454146 RepID=A0A934RJX8_9BACT|nr:urea ABC transporter ATP-binding subunit UrtE [Roseibacillus ishigakijimensis]MBK1833062.1 urea ABC transporter ATP-binding subunit UrtE [Roseibacillus ishigakijimensis]